MSYLQEENLVVPVSQALLYVVGCTERTAWSKAAQPSEAHRSLRGGPHTTRVPVRWPRSVTAAWSGGKPRARLAPIGWTPVKH